MVQHKVEQHIVELAHMPEDSCRTYSEMTRDRVEANVQTQEKPSCCSRPI